MNENEPQSYEEYMWSLISQGFISDNGHPLKCRFCDSEKFMESDEYFDERGRVEYQVSCADCKEKLSIWAYGNWNLL